MKPVIAALICAALLTAQPATVDAANPFVYTPLGDSLAFGAFALIGHGYVPLYDRFLEADTGASLQLINLGVLGWTSQDLVQALRTNLIFRLSVYYSNVVTFNIGGNDLSAARNRYKTKTCGGPDNQDCLKAAVANFKSNWSGIIAEIRRLRQGRPTIIRTMDIYNPFVNIDRATDTWPGDGLNDFQVVKLRLDDVNAYIASTAADNHILFAKVYDEFNGPSHDQDASIKNYLSFDQFHPNDLGHTAIARLLRGLGYAATLP